ncbi:MAG: MraY family glycosyltransferase [Bacillota bacterium]|nr:MraY family glycosyltransferase [Bacillota bacterium]
MIFNYIKAFVFAAAIVAILTPIAIKIAPKIGAMDIPKDARRMHSKPIPRFGGLGIYLGMTIAILVCVPRIEGILSQRQVLGFLAGGAMIVILGIVDDLKGLPAKVKLIGQIICSAVPCFFSVRFFGITNIFTGGIIVFPAWFSIIITIIWIVGITNTINLIDGLDGLAAGVSCISCIAVAYTAYLAGRPETAQLVLCIAGAAFGFLIFNFNPAKIFMGDAGSMLLGYSLATMSLIGVSSTKGTVLFVSFIPIIILALPIFDTAFAIIRRVANHKPIMAADKGHLHHRIMALGFSQRRAVIALYCITAIMGIAGILWTMRMRLEGLILAVIGATLIGVFLGINPEEEKENDEDLK